MSRPRPQTAVHRLVGRGGSTVRGDEAVHLRVGDQLQGDRRHPDGEGDPGEPHHTVPGTGHRDVDRQHADEDLQGREEVDGEEVGEETEAPGRVSQQGVAPVLVVQAGKTVDPVAGESHRPVEHHHHQQPAAQRPRIGEADRALPPPEHQQHRRDHAPVGVIETGIAECPAEHEHRQGGHHVGDQGVQPQPAGARTQAQPCRGGREGDQICQRDHDQRTAPAHWGEPNTTGRAERRVAADDRRNRPVSIVAS